MLCPLAINLPLFYNPSSPLLRSKYDRYLAGSGRDRGLKVGNRWLRHDDAPGVCRSPPKIEGASLSFERGTHELRVESELVAGFCFLQLSKVTFLLLRICIVHFNKKLLLSSWQPLAILALNCQARAAEMARTFEKDNHR